jgi:hypothetical protein
MMGLDITIQAITNKESGVKENHRASRTLRKCFRGNVEGRSPDSKERNKMKTEMYKNYKIKIWKQTPGMDYEKRNFDEEFQGCGTHGYQVFNPKGESIHLDYIDMWDEDACYENACQDVDADLEVNNESA